MTSPEDLKTLPDPHSLGDALPVATQRARAQILQCHQHGGRRLLALAALLEEELQRADRAMIAPDLVQMLVAFRGLQVLDTLVGQAVVEVL